MRVARMLCWWALVLLAAPAQAHLMAAQKGTINIVGDAAFMVLSVPVSAFSGVDDDGDGALSKDELDQHQGIIRQQIRAGLQLTDAQGDLPLQLVMVDLASDDRRPLAPASHLVVMGRFQSPVANMPKGLSFQFSLFGRSEPQQQQDITVTRQAQSQWLRFTPEHTSQMLLPSTLVLLGTYLMTGALHVLSGPDHMVFLLVVLSAAWHWRAMLAALTCFTLGHALTLALVVLGGWSARASIVEPAIAATIILMAQLAVAALAWGVVWGWRRLKRKASAGETQNAIFQSTKAQREQIHQVILMHPPRR